MTSEPEILSTQRDEGSVRLQLRIPRDLAKFRGHFPGLAIVPGVTQVDWAIRYGRAHFPLAAGFSRLSLLKFMQVIRPGAELTLRLSYNAAAGELGFRYEADGSVYSSGRAVFTRE
ncbi:MAG: thioester dehydrase [Stenotrophobium sp.]